MLHSFVKLLTIILKVTLAREALPYDQYHGDWIVPINFTYLTFLKTYCIKRIKQSCYVGVQTIWYHRLYIVGRCTI